MSQSVEEKREKIAALLSAARPAALAVRPPTLEEQRAAVASLQRDPILWRLLASFIQEKFGTSDPDAMSAEALCAVVKRSAVLISMLSDEPQDGTAGRGRA